MEYVKFFWKSFHPAIFNFERMISIIISQIKLYTWQTTVEINCLR